MTTSAEGHRPISVELTPHSDRFDPDDDRWATQVGTLWQALEDEAGTVRRDSSQVPGHKGGVETIILALGSAGAISAMVEVVKAWLGRDRTRSLKLTTVDEAGARRTVTVHGEQVDDATMREALKVLAGSGDAGWPRRTGRC